MNQILQQHQQQIHALAKENNISYLGLFGSYARNEAAPESDIDLVVKFSTPGGLLRRASIKRKLEKILGKPVDLISQNAISPLLRPFIEKDLIDIYPGIV